jgi:hypothetical protein
MSRLEACKRLDAAIARGIGRDGCGRVFSPSSSWGHVMEALAVLGRRGWTATVTVGPVGRDGEQWVDVRLVDDIGREAEGGGPVRSGPRVVAEAIAELLRLRGQEGGG